MKQFFLKQNVLGISIVLSAVLLFSAAQAQNLQLHYDFGRNIYPDEEAGRPKVTATFEQFKSDALGSWFYFIDLDFSNKGMEGSYMEISREFNLGEQSPFAAHVEYNGGLNSGAVFQPAALIGGAWNGHNADFSTTYSVQLLYKRYFTGKYNAAFNSVQLTGVWSTTFAGNALTFSGYIDFWREEKPNSHGKLVWMSEPQLWYNVNKNLIFGTEIEVSNNFIFNTKSDSDKSLFFNPTLAVKWTF